MIRSTEWRDEHMNYSRYEISLVLCMWFESKCFDASVGFAHSGTQSKWSYFHSCFSTDFSCVVLFPLPTSYFDFEVFNTLLPTTVYYVYMSVYLLFWLRCFLFVFYKQIKKNHINFIIYSYQWRGMKKTNTMNKIILMTIISEISQ